MPKIVCQDESLLEAALSLVPEEIKFELQVNDSTPEKIFAYVEHTKNLRSLHLMSKQAVNDLAQHLYL